MPMPDFSVVGRAALITGAGRGIALALAQTLAAGGAGVMLHDIDLNVAEQEADAINAAGGKAFAIGGDATNPSIAEALVSKTIERFGGLNILINSVSIQKFQPFFEHTIEQMQRELTANVLLATRLCQLAIPHMQKGKWGRIINFGSIQGIKGNESAPAYAMSRAAMSNLTSGLARRFGPDGITVNCISPGIFDTFRNRGYLDHPDQKTKSGQHIPAQRIGEPEDCAGLCLLLCSKAGEYITGQTIYVDGGMSVR